MNPLANQEGGYKSEKGQSKQAITLNGQLLALLLGKLGQLLEDSAEVLAIGILVLASRLGGHHDHTSRTLGSGGGTELSAGSDENVGNTVVFAQNGDVRDDVHGGDVSGKNDDRGGNIDGGVSGGDGGLAESLDDLLDTALERLVDGSCKIRNRLVNSSIGWQSTSFSKYAFDLHCTGPAACCRGKQGKFTSTNRREDDRSKR